MKVKILIFLGTALLMCQGHAIELQAQHFQANSKRRLEANIGEGAQNRIYLEGDDIIAVAGDESKYDWIADSLGTGNLFIIPKAKVGQRIDISIIAKSGLTQDLSLKIIDKDSHTIFLNTPLKEGETINAQSFSDEQVLKLIQSVFNPDKSKKVRGSKTFNGFKLTAVQEIQEADMRCNLFKITSINKTSQAISKDSLIPHFKNIIAVGLPNPNILLNAGESKMVIIVTKKGV